MIRTGNYKNFGETNYLTVSISKDRGMDANYEGKCFLDLAPKESFFRTWRNNIGKISEEENNKYYIEEYYKQILAKLDPEEIHNKLCYNILLCYEDSNQFCHRHIVAAWLELMLGIKVPEIIIEKGLIKEVEAPSYIKEYLAEVINKNRRGSNLLRIESQELEEFGKCCDVIKQGACFLKWYEDEEEVQYNQKQLNKIKKD